MPDSRWVSLSARVVKKELRYVELARHGFKIPPHDPFHQMSASETVDGDVTALGMFAHMHVRGKDMTFRAIRRRVSRT